MKEPEKKYIVLIPKFSFFVIVLRRKLTAKKGNKMSTKWFKLNTLMNQRENHTSPLCLYKKPYK